MLKTFFPTDGIFQEVSCEKINNCNLNEILFKGVTSTWLSFTAMLVPETNSKIMPLLEKSAVAAGKSCSGKDSAVCGIQWHINKYDDTSGMEQQVSASDVILASMAQFSSTNGPVTAKTGGNSTSNPNAGENEDLNPGPRPMTTGDRVGAAFVTLTILAAWLVSIIWLSKGYYE
jgi:mannan endo-1,6-alpha-mannosidase